MRFLIREHRKAAHLSVEELSGLCGVSETHITRLENGARDVRLSTLCKLARGLHVHPTDLIDWEDGTKETSSDAHKVLVNED
jgi:transcriptional regulator with XRE-family HTH domain